LVSCVTSFDEKLWPSMTSIGTNVLFFIQTNLYCCTNSLSMKHVDAWESKKFWASVITSLLHLTMIGIKKHGVGFEGRFWPFLLPDASRFNFAILIKTRYAHFSTPLVMDW
jgi:hypothetical protein